VLQPIGETALSSDGLTLYFIGKQSYYNETITTTTNYNESLYAINTKDGKGKWSFKLGTGNFTTFPFTDEGGVMFSLDRSMLFVGADLNKLSQYLFAVNTDS
jgi:outer membrane protein assembly factor BamB